MVDPGYSYKFIFLLIPELYLNSTTRYRNKQVENMTKVMSSAVFNILENIVVHQPPFVGGTRFVSRSLDFVMCESVSTTQRKLEVYCYAV